MSVLSTSALIAVLATAIQQPDARPVALRQGLVIDTAAGLAYVMAQGGGIAALDLATGAPRWTSNVADKPLLLVGNLLVAQLEPTRAGPTFGIATLDTRARGQAVSRGTIDLPQGVRVSLGETLHGTFSVEAQRAGGDVVLTWSFVPAPVRGMEETPGVSKGQPRRRGAIRLRPATGTLTPADTSRFAPPPRPVWIVTAGKIAGAVGTQYESADGRHLLVSERVADDREWDRYRWALYDRAGGRRLGEFRSSISFAPFVVRDSLVVFETTPYERAGRPAEPAKLRAVALASGREAWSVPVRETVFRGPVPP